MKLFAFDLDGTALTAHRHLSQRNAAALQRLHESGVVIVPATGRLLSFLPESVWKLKGLRYLITSNGASLYDSVEERLLYENTLSSEKAAQVQRVLNEFPVYVEYYAKGEAMREAKYRDVDWRAAGVPEDRLLFFMKEYQIVDGYLKSLAEGLRPEKINLPFVPAECYDELWQTLAKVQGIHLVSSIKGNIEINAEGCNKGAALAFLAEHLGFSAEQIMAIGDNGNDVEMLEFAGISVAMGDATEAAKRAARYETALCAEDGLAEAVAKFLPPK